MIFIQLRHSAAASITTFAPALLLSATMALGGDVYFGSFDNAGGQWALVNNHYDEPQGIHFIGFIPSRGQLIVGSPYYFDVGGGHFGEFRGYAGEGYEGEIFGNGQVKGMATLGTEPASSLGTYSEFSFSGAIDVPIGPASRFTGSWSWSERNAATGVTDFAYAFVGPSGKAMVFVGADCGVGSIDDDGNLKVSFAFGSRAIARIDPVTRRLVVYPSAAKKDPPAPETSASRLVNFSVRANLISVPARLTAEFVVRGSEKPVLIRAVGPGLRPFLSGSALTDDPQLAVFGSSALLASNDNWDSKPALAAAFETTGAFPLGAESKDAAVLATLKEYNVAYLTGPRAGIGLLEVFDLASNDNSHFSRFAVFHSVGGSAGDLVAGFVVAGTGTKTILVRGLGPALPQSDFRSEPVDKGDPNISVYRADGSTAGMNDDWSSSLAATFQQVGASPLLAGSKDAALLLELQPGVYTVVLSSTRSQPLLLEIFEVP